MEDPETKYVAVGDADVAYQVIGEGPPDLLYFFGIGTHVDLRWDFPPNAQLAYDLASFSRLIWLDRRGTGASDRVPRTAIPTWEEWTEDITAVLDAVESERAAVFAELDAGPIAILFSAMQPERVTHLILANTTARYTKAEDYPAGVDEDFVAGVLDVIGKGWGTTDFIRTLNDPDVFIDKDDAKTLARTLRASSTPGSALAHWTYMLRSADARQALPLVQAPTLVLRNANNPFLPAEQVQYLVQHISTARLIEIPGTAATINHTEYPLLADLISEFITGQRRLREPDRALATVLFTDIVSSTERIAQIGDRKWSELLTRHNEIVDRQIRTFRGRYIDSAGDGVFAIFDGPARAIRCACAIRDTLQPLGIEVRAGLHTGEIELAGEGVRGIAVHIGARVSAVAGPGEVLVSRTVTDLVAGSGLEFEERGEHELKGVPGTWAIYAVKP